MAFLNPTVDEFKAYFTRDFPFGTDPEVAVLDSDIAKAFQQTNILVNQALFDNQESYSVGYELMSAHFMTMNLRASSQGINGQFAWLESSKSVGGVSQGLAIPDRIQANPEFAMMFKTNYGAMYMQLILPQLVGQIYTVAGTTRA